MKNLALFKDIISLRSDKIEKRVYVENAAVTLNSLCVDTIMRNGILLKYTAHFNDSSSREPKNFKL